MPRPPREFSAEVLSPLAETNATVRIPPGDYELPVRFRVTVRLNEPHYLSLGLVVEMVAGGEPRVVSLTVEPMTGASSPVTTAVLRSIPVEAITRLVVEKAKKPAPPPAWPFPPGGWPDTRRYSLGGSAAAQAATIYIRALDAGSRAPTLAVAKAMHLSRTQASRYIAEARNTGLLPPIAQEGEK